MKPFLGLCNLLPTFFQRCQFHLLISFTIMCPIHTLSIPSLLRSSLRHHSTFSSRDLHSRFCSKFKASSISCFYLNFEVPRGEGGGIQTIANLLTSKNNRSIKKLGSFDLLDSTSYVD